MISREVLAQKELGDGTIVYVVRCVFKDNDGYTRVNYIVEDDFDNYDAFKTKAKALRYLKNNC